MEIRFRRKNLFNRYEELTKFDIYINGENTYYAESKQLALVYTTNLYTTINNNTISLRLKVKRMVSFVPHYSIRILNGDVFTFNTVSFWAGHFQCTFGPSIFDVYYYRNGKCAVYKDDRQVAFVELPTLHSGIINTDNDCDQEMIMAFVLIMDRSTSKGAGWLHINLFRDIFYAGIGRIKPFARAYNPDWVPK